MSQAPGAPVRVRPDRAGKWLPGVRGAAGAGAVLAAELGDHRGAATHQLLGRQDPVVVDAGVDHLVQLGAVELVAADLAPAVPAVVGGRRPGLVGGGAVEEAEDVEGERDGGEDEDDQGQAGEECGHGRTTVMSWPRVSTGPIASG